jgi:hypothetical protein
MVSCVVLILYENWNHLKVSVFSDDAKQQIPKPIHTSANRKEGITGGASPDRRTAMPSNTLRNRALRMPNKTWDRLKALRDRLNKPAWVVLEDMMDAFESINIDSLKVDDPQKNELIRPDVDNSRNDLDIADNEEIAPVQVRVFPKISGQTPWYCDDQEKAPWQRYWTKVEPWDPMNPILEYYEGPVPSDAVPSDAVPSDAVPSDAVPSDAVPSDLEYYEQSTTDQNSEYWLFLAFAGGVGAGILALKLWENWRR